MPLTILTGPAGSGKTGEVLERFTALLGREPVLVVPTRADVERFEDELLVRRPVALGGRIVTFQRLFDLAAAAAGLVGAPALTSAQRRAVLASVVEKAELDVLAESARRRGFVDALERFLDELQSALVSPARMEGRLATPHGEAPRRRARHLDELATLYRAYVERRDALGRSDAHSLAEATIVALRGRPEAWGGRPLLLHGFDDLTPAQLALVGAVAEDADVLASVVHERGRGCLTARGALVESLAGATGEAPARVELPPRPGRGVLAHLERTFLEEPGERRAPDDGLGLLVAGGLRAEVEQAGAEIARLLRAGVAADEVAVIVRSVEPHAQLIEDVLGGYGIPIAINAERPLTGTAAGGGLLALLRAALTTGSAPDLVAFLRTPARAPAGMVDRLERTVRRAAIEDADEALVAWTELGGWPPREVEWLREAGRATGGGTALLDRCREIARGLFELPHRRSAPVLDAAGRSELAAAEALDRTLAELAELAAADPELAPSPEALVALLEQLVVPRAAASVAGRVEVMSPYRARARQYPHVFLLSLQEGEFPRRAREDPFVTDEERREAGLPERADTRDEERYLFYVCLTRATRRLRLSYRSSDDEGRAATRSFLVDEVLDLLEPGADERIAETRSLGATVPEPQRASTERELARALAADELTAPPPELGAHADLTARLSAALSRAGERSSRLPGPMRVPFVREQFAQKLRIGASSLETYAECPFRYFVGHELRPRELAAPPEPLERGGLTHRVLERVYDEHGRPTPGTLATAIDRACAILAEEADGTSLDPARARARPGYRRMESDVTRFLHYDARHAADGSTLAVEAAFGAHEGDDRPSLELDGFDLHGKIDRIDGVGSGQALIRDYKTGASVSSAADMKRDSKLQLPLYMLAVRRLWGLEPVGGVYHALGDQRAERPRGLLRESQAEALLGEGFFASDLLDDQAFEARLDEARAEAEALAGRIHAGHLGREPLHGRCPRHCDFHAICRRERGEKNPVENGRPREEGDDDVE